MRWSVGSLTSNTSHDMQREPCRSVLSSWADHSRAPCRDAI